MSSFVPVICVLGFRRVRWGAVWGVVLAGPVAAQLFSFQCWIGLVLGTALMLVLRRQRAWLTADTSSQALPDLRAALISMALVALAVLLAMTQVFGVARKIVTARATGGDLRLWHSLGSVLVLGQWLSAGAVLWRLAAPRRSASPA